MTKHQRDRGADRSTWNNILLIWICSTLQSLHPVNLSGRTISPRTAAIYLIFPLNLTHDFIVQALAEVLHASVCLCKTAEGWLLWCFFMSEHVTTPLYFTNAQFYVKKDDVWTIFITSLPVLVKQSHLEGLCFLLLLFNLKPIWKNTCLNWSQVWLNLCTPVCKTPLVMF